ncbi:hypothetical protein FRC00_006100 [Tulasnella sp. 408]|nr:hypothetical protein FRC00_006100 [Tulasnella sp. 408]
MRTKGKRRMKGNHVELIQVAPCCRNKLEHATKVSKLIETLSPKPGAPDLAKQTFESRPPANMTNIENVKAVSIQPWPTSIVVTTLSIGDLLKNREDKIIVESIRASPTLLATSAPRGSSSHQSLLSPSRNAY